MKKAILWGFLFAGIFTLYGIALSFVADRLYHAIKARTQHAYPPLLGPSFTEDATPTEKQKQWALATCAIRITLNGRSNDVLGGQTEEDRGGRLILQEAWGVTNRTSLIQTLNDLEYGGHRKNYHQWAAYLEDRSPAQLRKIKRDAAQKGKSYSNRIDRVLATRKKFEHVGLAGWDFSRYIALCGWGFQAHYLTEREAWSRIMPAARLLQKTFSSWGELADNYAEGRVFWSLEESPKKQTDLIQREIRFLLWDPYSPWTRLDWNMNLSPEKQRDDGSAEFRLGRCWFYGFGNRKETIRNREKAVAFFRQAAEKGNLDGMFWLALCYQQGQGVETDTEEACSWFQKAANLDDGPSQYELGQCYYQGKGIKKDKDQMAKWMKQAAAHGGGPKADAFVGWCYEEGYGGEQSFSEAANWYLKAANAGEPWAQNNLGECYSKGIGVAQNLFKAAHWFKRSAEGGFPPGMFHWGECLEKGCGVLKNEEAAKMWFLLAADKGEPAAKKKITTGE